MKSSKIMKMYNYTHCNLTLGPQKFLKWMGIVLWILLFACLLNWLLTLEGQDLLFLLPVDPILKGPQIGPDKQTGSHSNCFPL